MRWPWWHRSAAMAEPLLALGIGVIAVAWVVAGSEPAPWGVGYLALLFGFLLCCAALGAIRIVSALLAGPGGRKRALWRRPLLLWLPPALFAAAVAVTEAGVPFRLRFELSRAALEALARGGADRQPAWVARSAGLFHIYSVAAEEGGRMRLELGACGFLDSCAFIYDPRTAPGEPRRHERQIDQQWRLLVEPF